MTRLSSQQASLSWFYPADAAIVSIYTVMLLAFLLVQAVVGRPIEAFLLLPSSASSTITTKSKSMTTSSRVSMTTTRIVTADRTSTITDANTAVNWIVIPEEEWRLQAKSHRERIRDLLRPGLTDPDNVINSGRYRRQRGRGRRQRQTNSQDAINDDAANTAIDDDDNNDGWTSLDPKHPIFNFLIEYYGLKGSKGPRRLARWFPNPAMLLSSSSSDKNNNGHRHHADGILLEGATEDDWGSGRLHLRGAQLVSHPKKGIVYSPAIYYGSTLKKMGEEEEKEESNNNDDDSSPSHTTQEAAVTPFLWYQSILRQTLQADPVLHCYCLHEWAMQYHPQGAPPPPSAKYQSHLNLRVSQATINDTVERKGIRCTHVDALRYFAPAAGPFNVHGAQLQRLDQLRLEQPACVHAQMDLIKLALRLQPFCDPTLIPECLDIAIQGRRLDVASSPYDAYTVYGVKPIPVECAAGRTEFQRQQVELMEAAEPVRRRLLEAYDVFLKVAFGGGNDDDANQLLKEAERHPAAERFAKAEPGGLPWRKNLVVVADAETTATAPSSP